MAFAAGQAARPAVAWARGKVAERRTYTVKVLGSDDLYDDVHDWVLTLLPRDDQRALVAWSTRRSSYPVAESGPGDPPATLRLRYDGTRQQVIRVAGHRVTVLVADGTRDGTEHWRPPEIVFTTATAAGRDALLGQVAEVLRRSQQAKRKPVLRMLDKWGEWSRHDDQPPVPLESVVLADGQMGRLTADISRFLAAERDYTRRGIPWHRGHLYHGPPGTGKTSAARALAAHFGMDTWYLSLGDLKTDGQLLGLASRIGPRSMLLLEDVDVFQAATSREDTSGRVTLSGLLNTLDGIATPHGLLTVMTSNHPEALDAAGVRAGRIDAREHFGLADADHVARLVSHYYDGTQVTGADVGPSVFTAPAEVIDACKRHDDAAAAIATLRAAGAAAVAA
jgi:hypothetical protein